MRLTSTSSDGSVIRASVSKPQAFAALFDRHARVIWGYACRRVGPAAADEVVNETFLRAFSGRSGYDVGLPDARPWLFGIATNVIREHARGGGKEPAMTPDLERVREVYPDAQEPSAERLASLRASLLEAIDASVQPQPRRDRQRFLSGPRQHRGPIPWAIVAAACAVVAVALLLGNSGGPTPRGVTSAEARAILRGAAAGLAVPAGAVLHVADTNVETFSNGHGWTRSREQVWQETSYPYNERIIGHISFSFAPPSSQEYAIVDNVMQLYDPQRNTIYTDQPPPFTIRPAAQAGRYLLTPTHDTNAPTITITAAQLRALRDGQDTIIYETRHHVSVVSYRSIRHQQPFLDSIRKTALALLHSGHAQVLYNVQFAGRAAIEISGPGPGTIPAIRREIYYVAPLTYQPRGFVQRWAGKSGETWTTRFTTYRLLPGTVANRALVTLPGAHPNATIDTNPADYNAAFNRLFK